MEARPVKPCDGPATMTLDEAIKHAEAKSDDTPCGREHAALAAWLRELQRYRNSNVAKLREALEEVVELDVRDDYAHVCLRRVVAKCEAALSEPLRNCDVGTAEEQYNRHDKYCNSQPTCRKCLREDAASTCIWCFAKWAQKPYEAPAVSGSK